MRKLTLFLLLLLPLASCLDERHGHQSTSVLFVGNSLTYVGDLPAVFEVFAEQNQHTAHTDMIVSGGATLTQRVADQSVAAALKSTHYDYVVFQERGGDALCSFGPDSCKDFNISLLALAKLARENHVSAVLLGTYQGNPEPSAALVNSEGLAAKHAGIPYLAVSELLLKGRIQSPDCQWFYTDGMGAWARSSKLTPSLQSHLRPLATAIQSCRQCSNVRTGNEVQTAVSCKSRHWSRSG